MKKRCTIKEKILRLKKFCASETCRKGHRRARAGRGRQTCIPERASDNVRRSDRLTETGQSLPPRSLSSAPVPVSAAGPQGQNFHDSISFFLVATSMSPGNVTVAISVCHLCPVITRVRVCPVAQGPPSRPRAAAGHAHVRCWWPPGRERLDLDLGSLIRQLETTCLHTCFCEVNKSVWSSHLKSCVK